jgi:5-methylthioribose kinase
LVEVSDGNLNLVHLVTGPGGRVCVKQALPYVRVDESWALPLERGANECAYLQAILPHVGALAPVLYAYDPQQTLIVMEALVPHRILRQELIDGRRIPGVAAAVGTYIARASFFTSDLYLPLERKFDLLAGFTGNHALRRISAELIFRDPYYDNPRNRWTSPQLDPLVAEIRADPALKLAAARLGARFLADSQALIHGDLHSGSVMVSADDTRVIDPEFASFGPIGLDLGAFAGNLLLAYFAQPGLGGDRAEYGEWILGQLAEFWAIFRRDFLALWREQGQGEAYPRVLFADPPSARSLEDERERYVGRLFADLLGFAAAKIIRRIVGFAHVADFETIADPTVRTAVEARALRLAVGLLKRPEKVVTLDDLLAAVRREQGHV